MQMHSTTQKWCTWSGMVAITLFIGALAIAGFIPPLHPQMPAADVAAYYQNHGGKITFGMLLMMISGAFIPPMVAVIGLHMWRMEGKMSILTLTQLSAGTASALFYSLPGLAFLITAYRPERSPELTVLLNDLSWILFAIEWPFFATQNIALGAAILMNVKSGANPIFPRWLGYFNFWIAMCYAPASFLVFFRDGPFAWHSIFAFWIPGPAFIIWFCVMTAMLLRAINRQEWEQSA